MPLTPAEKQKNYRDRLKERGKYYHLKEKETKRKQVGRAKLCEKAREELRIRNRLYQRRARQKKIELSRQSTCNIESEANSLQLRDIEGANS